MRKKKVPQQSLTRFRQDWEFLTLLETLVYFLTPVLILFAQEGRAKGGREERKNNKFKILDIKVKILDIKNLN